MTVIRRVINSLLSKENGRITFCDWVVGLRRYSTCRRTDGNSKHLVLYTTLMTERNLQIRLSPFRFLCFSSTVIKVIDHPQWVSSVDDSFSTDEDGCLRWVFTVNTKRRGDWFRKDSDSLVKGLVTRRIFFRWFTDN